MVKQKYVARIKVTGKCEGLAEILEEIAEKRKIRLVKKHMREFYIKTNYSRRHSADHAIIELYNSLIEIMPRKNIVIDVENSDMLLEDLLNQAESKALENKDILIDNLRINYLSPKYAAALKKGRIKTYLGIDKRRSCKNINYGCSYISLLDALKNARGIIKDLKNSERMGALVSLEMLHGDLNIAYFGAFINLTGNYRTKLHSGINPTPSQNTQTYSKPNALKKCLSVQGG